jgi:hypothetical protein
MSQSSTTSKDTETPKKIIRIRVNKRKSESSKEAESKSPSKEPEIKIFKESPTKDVDNKPSDPFGPIKLGYDTYNRRVRIVRISAINNTDPEKLKWKQDVFNKIDKSKAYIIMDEMTRKGDAARSFDLKTLYSVWFEDEIEPTNIIGERINDPYRLEMSFPRIVSSNYPSGFT